MTDAPTYFNPFDGNTPRRKYGYVRAYQASIFLSWLPSLVFGVIGDLLPAGEAKHFCLAIGKFFFFPAAAIGASAFILVVIALVRTFADMVAAEKRAAGIQPPVNALDELGAKIQTRYGLTLTKHETHLLRAGYAKNGKFYVTPAATGQTVTLQPDSVNGWKLTNTAFEELPEVPAK